MAKRFKIGDHVSWNSEAGRVSGRVIAIHTSNFDYKGYVHHASVDDPQYEIKSDKSAHIAAHRGSALDYMPDSTPDSTPASTPDSMPDSASGHARAKGER